MRGGKVVHREGTLRIALSYLLPFDLGPRTQQRMWAVVVGRGIPERNLLELWSPGECVCAGTFLSLWLQLPMLKLLQRVTSPGFTEP